MTGLWVKGLLLACSVACFTRAQQFPFAVDPLLEATPLAFKELELQPVSDSNFTTLWHPAYPKHSVRIKSIDGLCDGTVKAFSGYIDIDARHLFFYFFESRNDPGTDPVMMWINGGPGGSSAIGLFMELGPCLILDENGPKSNPHSWNSNANLFFIDQPVGVGYSYADHNIMVGTTEEAAIDIAAFTTIFFETFSKFKGRAFHMAGESFGGRYVPVFASAIHDANSNAEAEGRTPINLTSILLGNGVPDTLSWYSSWYTMQCTAASLPPVVSIGSCVRMRKALPRCLHMVERNCVDTFDEMNCRAARAFCEEEIVAPFDRTGRNPYDFSKKCVGEAQDTLCYPGTKHIADYLNRPDVRTRLGAEPQSRIGNFSLVALDVNQRFDATGDTMKTSEMYVAELLERGVRVLVYAGTYDMGCNWVGGLSWTSKLQWTGHDAYNADELRAWKVDGAEAGLKKSGKGLTFATVEAGGHMAPYDKPAESLAMVQRWLAGEHL